VSDLTVTADLTDIEDFQLVCIYDEILGVLKIVQILDDSDQVVYEFRLTSAIVSPEGGISGYNLYMLVSTIILLIGFISILAVKKIKLK
jgi:hypothetical protein